MQTLQAVVRSGADGLLQLQIPVGQADQEYDVTVHLQPRTVRPDPLGWPAGFFEQTAGCLTETPLERGEQGSFEEREPLG
jgi:hypothetical protein